MSIYYSGASHIGKVKKNNEDNWLVKPIKADCELIFAAVADGVGGLPYGEVASAILHDHYQQIIDENKLAPATNTALREPMLDMSARTLHAKIASEGTQSGKYRGMACTQIACIADASSVSFANIGDSRLYLFSKDKLRQMSKDQTIAQALVDCGRLQADKFNSHPDRHVLQYALGIESINDPLTPQLGSFKWQAGDHLLLCSDGLSDMLADHSIASLMAKLEGHDALDGLIKILIEKSNEAGGRDNITAVILGNYE